MKDGFTTDNLQFAIALVYLYRNDSLVRITSDENKRLLFHFDVESCDAQLLYDQWQKDDLSMLAKSFCVSYSYVTQVLKGMRRTNQDSWVSPAWVSGRGK